MDYRVLLSGRSAEERLDDWKWHLMSAIENQVLFLWKSPTGAGFHCWMIACNENFIFKRPQDECNAKTISRWWTSPVSRVCKHSRALSLITRTVECEEAAKLPQNIYFLLIKGQKHVRLLLRFACFAWMNFTKKATWGTKDTKEILENTQRHCELNGRTREVIARLLLNLIS